MVRLNIGQYIHEHIREEFNKRGGDARTHERLNNLEIQLNAQAVGVQNVYNQFSALTDSGFIRDFEAKKRELDTEMKRIRKDMDECMEFVRNAHKKMSRLEDFYQLALKDPELINKLAKIVKVMEDE